MVSIDTGAARTVMSMETYNELPVQSRFSLHEENTEMHAADGRRIKNYGYGEAVLLLSTQEVPLNIFVADIDDAGILGMDFLSATNASIDVVGRRPILSGEVINCPDSSSKPLSFRCFIRRSIVVGSNSEMAIPVVVSKRQWKSKVPKLHRGVRNLEPCTSPPVKEERNPCGQCIGQCV